MKNTFLASLWLPLVLPFLSCCQVGRTATERMMWSTYPTGTIKGEATCFIVNNQEPKAGRDGSAVVFTSSHVLDTLEKEPVIMGVRVVDDDGEVRVVMIGFRPPRLRGQEKFYVRHPRHDLAAFTLHIPAGLAGVLDTPSALTTRTILRSAKSLHAGDEVFFLGYPEVLPGTRAAFAVLRGGHVASYPLGVALSDGTFYINADVYPGDSGAPVFRTGRGRPCLAGVVSRRVCADALNFSHLAVAMDADVVRETLALLTASEKAAVPLTSAVPAMQNNPPKHS